MPGTTTKPIAARCASLEQKLRAEFHLPAGLIERNATARASEAVMVITVAFLLLIALLVISAYVSRLYTESGKFLSREFQENIELFEHQIEPRLGFKHERAALSFALLEQLLTASICFLLAYSVFSQPGWTAEDAAQAVFFVIIVILIFDRFLPYLLFSRTRGGWLVRFTLSAAPADLGCLSAHALSRLSAVRHLAHPSRRTPMKNPSIPPRPSMPSSKPARTRAFSRRAIANSSTPWSSLATKPCAT